MGQTVPIRQQFMPTEICETNVCATITKIWSYHQQGEVMRQLNNLQRVKLTQEPFQCRIEAVHSQFLRAERQWKVIAAFQYFPSSLRQQIITRKKQQSYGCFYTEKELQCILNVASFYIFKYYNYLCHHSDVFSSLFLCGKEVKMCHPQLMPNRCQNPLCDKSHFKNKLIDAVMELLLLQKVIKADYRHKHRAQKLYSHAPWLVQLLNDLMDSTSDLLDLCRRSQAVRLYFSIHRRGSSGKQTQLENVRQSTYSGGERMAAEIKEEGKYEAKPETYYRSHSAELQNEKARGNKFMNNRVQNRFNLHSLEQYQKEIVESVGGDHQESILLPSYPLSEALQGADQIRERYDIPERQDAAERQQEEETPETQSFMLLEQIQQQQDSSLNQHNRSVHSVPMTIFEEENENYSQDSKKYLGKGSKGSSSQSMLVSEGDIRYEGDLVNGKRHGKGTMLFGNGAYYAGSWIDDQMHGFGTLYYASGNPEYIGEWSNSKFNGKGCYFNENMEYFDGGFDYRDFDELGRKWKSCQGEFREDMMEGQGILTLSNGQVLKARWRKNLLNGEGIFFTLQNKQVKGVWFDNKLYSCEIQHH